MHVIGSIYSETKSLTFGDRCHEGEAIFPGHYCAVLDAWCPRHDPMRKTTARGWPAGPHEARYQAEAAFVRLAPFICLRVCGGLGGKRALQGAWHDGVSAGVVS